MRFTRRIPDWNPEPRRHDKILDAIDMLDRMNQKDFRMKKDAVIGVLLEQREAMSESPYWVDGIAFATKKDYLDKMKERCPEDMK